LTACRTLAQPLHTFITTVAAKECSFNFTHNIKIVSETMQNKTLNRIIADERSATQQKFNSSNDDWLKIFYVPNNRT
jgi:hypothetical protein